MAECFVYWITPDPSLDISTCGYVGVSKDPAKRHKVHIREGRVPSGTKQFIIFSGTRKQCFAKERELRPKKGIGWNRAVGGAHGYREGFVMPQSAIDKSRENRDYGDPWNKGLTHAEDPRIATGNTDPSRADRMRKVGKSNLGKTSPHKGKHHGPRPHTKEHTEKRLAATRKFWDDPEKSEHLRKQRSERMKKYHEQRRLNGKA